MQTLTCDATATSGAAVRKICNERRQDYISDDIGHKYNIVTE